MFTLKTYIFNQYIKYYYRILQIMSYITNSYFCHICATKRLAMLIFRCMNKIEIKIIFIRFFYFLVFMNDMIFKNV